MPGKYIELTITSEMGKPAKEAGYVLGLVKVVETMPDDCGLPERVTPVSVREVVLSTALHAVCDADDWDAAMDICERIDQLHARRGASEHERARLRLNTAIVLLKQDRAESAEEVLRHCQAVFEDAEDIALLGEVFRLRAKVQDALGRADDALTMAQAGLRYSYQRSKPGDLAAGHEAVACYLADTGHPGQICLAHRLAAMMLRAAGGHAKEGATIVELSDVLEYGIDLFPRSLDELVERVEQTPGVRLEAALRSVVPHEADRDDLFDTVVARLRKNAGIAQSGLADYRDERAAMVEALNRAHAGDRSPSLFDGLADWSAEIVRAFIAERDAEASPEPAAIQEGPARRSWFRGGRRARTNREALLASIRARIAKSIETGESWPVTGRRGDREVADLIAFAEDAAAEIGPRIEIAHAIGWLHWQRFVTSPEDDKDSAEIAVAMLRSVFKADPAMVPDMLREVFEQRKDDDNDG